MLSIYQEHDKRLGKRRFHRLFEWIKNVGGAYNLSQLSIPFLKPGREVDEWNSFSNEPDLPVRSAFGGQGENGKNHLRPFLADGKAMEWIESQSRRREVELMKFYMGK